MTKIKICRIKHLSEFRVCGEYKADYVGIHIIDSIRPKDRILISKILLERNKKYPETKLVLVTKIKDIKLLCILATELSFDAIQLHFPTSLSFIKELKLELTNTNPLNKIQIIKVVTPEELGEVDNFDMFFGSANFLLIDKSHEGGSGEVYDLDSIKKYFSSTRIPLFLAGGLTVNNVISRIERVHPYGVDVQTKIELATSYKKQKDPIEVKNFISVVRGEAIPNAYFGKINRKESYISVALTDFTGYSLKDIIHKCLATDANFFHLDFSDGTLAPNLNVMPIETCAVIRAESTCFPYSIHLFLKSISKCQNIVLRCLEQNPFLVTVYYHVNEKNIADLMQTLQLCNWLKNQQINFGLAIESSKFKDNELLNLLNDSLSLNIDEYSLITRSNKGIDGVYRIEDLDNLCILRDWTFQKLPAVCVSVDREMNLDKLTFFKSGTPNHVIIGKSIVASTNADQYIAQLRSLLTGIKTT